MLHSNQPDIKSLVIREVHPGDVPILNRLFPQGIPDKHHERVLLHTQRSATYLTASVHDKPVGHVLILWDGLKSEGIKDVVNNCPAIEDLYIERVYRARGIGTRLLDECIKIARERGYTKLGISIRSSDTKTKIFFHKIGFIDSGIPEYKESWEYVDPLSGEKKKEEAHFRFFVKHF